MFAATLLYCLGLMYSIQLILGGYDWLVNKMFVRYEDWWQSKIPKEDAMYKVIAKGQDAAEKAAAVVRMIPAVGIMWWLTMKLLDSKTVAFNNIVIAILMMLLYFNLMRQRKEIDTEKLVVAKLIEQEKEAAR